MSEITQGLRNRFHNSTKDSTEELLIEKLDIFLSSIESRLDQFERYFKFNNIEDLDEYYEEEKTKEVESGEETDESHQGHGRRTSVSSVSSFKSFANLDMIHQRLKLIKQSVLKSSISNLEYLYKTLDDSYSYMFNSSEPLISSDISFDNSKEILSQKIIDTLQYFDERLTHIDDMIQRKTNQVITDESIFNIFKFYNFNKALKLGQHNYLHYYQMPLGWRENRYIINGYRFSLSHWSMFKSIFHFNHNESMNIWTHIVGLGILFYLGLVHLPSTEVFSKNTFEDNLAIYFFLFCAVACLTCSTIWHTYSCFARISTRYNCACVDYTGITFLITSSVVSVEYAALFNYPKLFRTFMTISIVSGVGGLAFNWSPYFDKPECRSIRIGYFVGLAALGVGTVMSLCFYEGFVKSFQFIIPIFYKSFVWYWIGVCFYGGLIPERWRYDVIINEDECCQHEHSASDILAGNPEKSGEEEYKDIENDITNQILNEKPPSDHESEAMEHEKFKSIINKHFPEQPIQTNYKTDFFSLWWWFLAFLVTTRVS
ncbi:inc metabolism membrane protein [Yamadazyma tenuis]|uniref:inc metabolism membrane protein n=1 Tax=Candida tenuis TaxID=2315449 RepID=UPI0027A982B9|nr:inc metabolism membrane protein [Yamadazyma tenuis]